jgi:primosomal protein N' (replication factor Y)
MKEELTYFTSADIPAGAIISVPLRKRTVPALVLSSEPVRAAKAELRTAAFQLRRIAARVERRVTDEAFLGAAKALAEYCCATEGSLLFSVIPQAILTDEEASTEPMRPHTPPKARAEGNKLILQAAQSVRFEQYKNMMRESFARKESTWILMPTIEEGEQLHAILSPGIGEHVYFLHGGLSKKKLRDTWKAILNDTHPTLTIMTGKFLALPRHDLGTIIIERESSPLYASRTRPFADTRVLAELLAERRGVRLIYADMPLRIETLHRFDKNELDELLQLPVRTGKRASSRLIDMRDERIGIERKPFVVLGKELLESLSRTLSAGGRAFLFASRRGIAPTTLCMDCGTTVTCNVCGAPVVLHRGERENIFLCHSCGSMRSASERCLHCGSWKLQSFGIGSQLIYSHLKSLAPENNVLLFDKDNVATHRTAKAMVRDFYETPGSIMVGTEMALPYLHEPIPVIGVVSMDALLSIPEWSVYESVFSAVTRLSERADEEFIIQTRRPDAEILKQALAGNMAAFYESDIVDRKRFKYPPFTTLIKITAEGTQESATALMNDIETKLEPYGFTAFPHVLRTPKGQIALHGFLRIPRHKWPDPEICRTLIGLPPSVTIRVNPERIL